MTQNSEGGTEATDLLTGQLEGANLLSELNIPDRVGMQAGDASSTGDGVGGAAHHAGRQGFAHVD